MSIVIFDPGEMRTQITLQEPTIVTDAGGAQSPTYANIGTNPIVWAKVVYDHGAEIAQADAVQVEQRATVTVRYRADIAASWQILMDSVAWKIISPPENIQNQNRWTVFRVERIKGTI